MGPGDRVSESSDFNFTTDVRIDPESQVKIQVSPTNFLESKNVNAPTKNRQLVTSVLWTSEKSPRSISGSVVQSNEGVSVVLLERGSSVLP